MGETAACWESARVKNEKSKAPASEGGRYKVVDFVWYMQP